MENSCYFLYNKEMKILSIEAGKLKINLLLFKIQIKVKKNYLQSFFYYFVKKITPFYTTNKKEYRYFVSLGRNCEFAFKFKYFYNFVDSTLLTYVGAYDRTILLSILENSSCFFEEGYEYNIELNDFICNKTGYFFHGRTRNFNCEINEKREYEELNSRINYLKEKTDKILKSEEKKLFIRTLDCENEIDDIEFIKKLHKILTQQTTNFDLLIIVEERFYSENIKNIEKDFNNLYVRKVKNHASFENVPLNEYIKGWPQILSEFYPSKELKKECLRKNKV